MDNEEIGRFISLAGLVFRGHVVAHRHPNLPASGPQAGEAVTMRIDQILRGAPVLEGAAGQDAIVMVHHAEALRGAGEVIVFAQCLSLGRHLTLRELSHVPADERAREAIFAAIEREEERPLRERVHAAALIVTGEVVEAEPAPGAPPPTSEHDPIWWVARLAIKSVLKGPKSPARVTVYFASSRDRYWAPSPKLYAGTQGIFLLHRPGEAERRDGLPNDGARAAYVARHPLDHLSLERLETIERLLGAENGER